MGDLLEVIMISSVGIVMVLILRLILKNQFGAFWRKFIWFLIAMRMLVFYNHSFMWGDRLTIPVIPMSSYNDLIIMNAIPGRTMDLGISRGILYEVPLVYLLLAGIVFVSIIKILAHHEEYGFAVNNLIEHTKPLNEGTIFQIFEQTKKELEIHKRITLYTSDRISSPMIIGYVHVGIVIPTKLMAKCENGEINEDYIRYVFLHELTHFQKKDIWYKRLMLLVSDLYWFNPLVHIMQKAAMKDLESCCDGYVVKCFSSEEKQRYCNILLDFLDGEQCEHKFQLGMSSAAKRVKERIDFIADNAHAKGGIWVIGIVIVMLLAGQIQIEKNTQYQHGLIHFSNQLMGEVMHACELKVKNALGFDVDISYESTLNRDVWTQEELGEAIHIYVKVDELESVSDEEREMIRIIIDSYFGVTMDVTFFVGGKT